VHGSPHTTSNAPLQLAFMMDLQRNSRLTTDVHPMGLNQRTSLSRAVLATLIISSGAFASLAARPVSSEMSMQDKTRDRLAGRGEIYYSGNSNKELRAVASRALNQLSEFRDVRDQGDNLIFVNFDDSTLMIDCIPSDQVPDRLCVSLLYGCKTSVKPDDPKLLKLVSDLNSTYNSASFSVLSLGSNPPAIQIQSCLPFLNYLSRDMLLAWFEFFESSSDAVMAKESERVRAFLK
jgi:hypothetical protein